MVTKKNYINLFLDRDGVINVERKNDYAKNPSEFIFEANALQALAILAKLFPSIYIITNQRGVGRGVMTLHDLEDVHNYMIGQIEGVGGRIDKIYYCTDIKSNTINRKPNIGMAFQVERDYPNTQFSKSIMVGNSKSDIEFGHKLGMYTVLIGDKYPKNDKIYDIANIHYHNLYEFALSLLS